VCFKDVLLRNIFLSKNEERTGDWKTLLNYFCCSPNGRAMRSRNIRFVGACGTYGGDKIYRLHGFSGEIRRKGTT
jgi:hypothetical protein